MNKRFFQRAGLAIVAALSVVACSQDADETVAGNAPAQMDEQGNYVYSMELNSTTPGYDDDATRAVSYTWDDGATLYLRLKSGSSYVAGTAVYSKSTSTWTLTANSSLSTTSTATNCEVYYFEDALTVSSSTVNMNQHTACYMTKDATYKHPSTNAISVTAELKPMTWRLRFKGTSGTTITMQGLENEVRYFSAFNRSTGEFTKAGKDISLTVSGSYTPYLYGELMYGYVDNNIVVRNGSYRYERDLYASDLPVGQSSFYTIPTASSYAGWSRTADTGSVSCKFVPNNLLVFPNGMTTDWTADANVAKGYYKVFKKSEASAMSDEQIITQTETNTVYTADELNSYVTSFHGDSFYTPGTDYVLCTIAYDSNGNRGELQKTEFTTRSSSLRQAELSDLKYGTKSGTSYWYFTVTARNNASSYYIYSNESQTVYDWDSQYLAYRVYYAIQNNEMGMSSSSILSLWGDLQVERSDIYFSTCTWAVISSKNLGNPSTLQGSTSSSAPQLVRVKAPERNDNGSMYDVMHPKTMVEDLLNTGRLILVRQ